MHVAGGRRAARSMGFQKFTMSPIVQGSAFALMVSCACGVVVAEPAISISPNPRMMLEEPSIQVSGAVSGGKVILEAALTDNRKQIRTSHGVFHAGKPFHTALYCFRTLVYV